MLMSEQEKCWYSFYFSLLLIIFSQASSMTITIWASLPKQTRFKYYFAIVIIQY